MSALLGEDRLVLAFRVRQKESAFYLVNYRAQDLVRRVRLTARAPRAREANPVSLGPAPADSADDPVARFVERVERAEGSFQREPMRAKIRSLLDFYRQVTLQPMIPGTVLLYTSETLDFRPLPPYEDLGDLTDPTAPFLVIDGQHRLGALRLFLEEGADGEAPTIQVPCLVFDGRQEDFAAEMFVLINSTATRINKSHLIDLYEKVSWTDPAQKAAARVVRRLYEEPASPLRYRINLLGGRSQKDKWMLQAELFHEVHGWFRALVPDPDDPRGREREVYGLLLDGLGAARDAFGRAWGDNDRYRVTTSVTLRAILRVLLALARQDAFSEGDRAAHWRRRLAPWSGLVEDFRAEGFYERFAAKGYVERVRRIQERLARAAGIELRGD
jgi:DGQHR domain-containing protein